MRLPADRLPAPSVEPVRSEGASGDADALYNLLPTDHRMSYDMHKVLRCLLDDGKVLRGRIGCISVILPHAQAPCLGLH